MSGSFYAGGTAKQSWTGHKDEQATRDSGSVAMQVKPGEKSLDFSFKDLEGRRVGIRDPRFKNKVVIVQLMGSWCPNCHDEAPFLVELYRKYHNKGLEIVGLSFEEKDQLADPKRLRAFIEHYGIEYPVLVPGEPAELNAKLPQAVNLNSWPTTIFIGRDGRVRKTHAGFAGKASGAEHQRSIEEIRSLVESLLAERVPSPSA